jgi:hypothetical protein
MAHAFCYQEGNSPASGTMIYGWVPGAASRRSDSGIRWLTGTEATDSRTGMINSYIPLYSAN